MKNIKICVIGLGYVGLPLALEFGKKFQTIGFDINKKRVNQLKNFKDINNEFSINDIKNSKKLHFTVTLIKLISRAFTLLLYPRRLKKIMSLIFLWYLMHVA